MRDGEPWFVAKDVADILGYGDTEAMTRRLKHNEKGYLRGVGTSGGAQEMSILNEPGLYRAIFGFRDSHDLNRLLDEDEKADPHIVRVSSATGVVQGRSFDLITESGLYHAVFASRKPEAKAFRKWVTSEVLPSKGGHELPTGRP